MDITSMKSLLELQAMQNLSTSNDTNSSTLSTNSTQFSELINELLNEQMLGSSDSLNGLGEVSSLKNLIESLQSTTGANSEDSSYIASFLLNSNSNYIPTSTFATTSSTVESSPSLEHYTKDYTGQQSYENLLAGAEKYSAEIAKAAKTYNIPEKLIASVMKQESNFNASAVSAAGASGLMQLMPTTARYLGVNDTLDPEQSIMGGAKYLRQMLDQFDNNVETALAAYNAGPGNVKKYDGIPPFKETQKYVKNIINYYNA